MGCKNSLLKNSLKGKQMRIRTTIITAVAVTIIAPAIALAGNIIQTGTTDAGKILTDGQSMSLYVFDKDSAAVSNCNGECAVKWPPLAASRSDRAQGKFGIIIRADGSRQWTYKGAPLYAWFKDAVPGDINGDGIKGVWHLARP